MGEHQFSYMAVTELREYKNNSRIHNPHQVGVLKKSIVEFGFINPIIIDAQNEIIAGHGRLMAAKELGMDRVPVLRVEDLTQDQIRAYRIADNKLVELGEWDEDLLSVELSALNENIFDLSVMGFNMEELNDLVEAINNFDDGSGPIDNGEPDSIEEEEIEVDMDVPAHSQTGQIYQLGPHRLLCGDSTNALQIQELYEEERADLIFTDPPYGVDYAGGNKKREKLANDHKGTAIYESFLSVALLYSKPETPLYLFYAAGKFSQSVINAVMESGGWTITAQIVWGKNVGQFGGFVAMNSNYKQKHEPILYCKRSATKDSDVAWYGPNNETTVWEIDRLPKNEYHPTEKPIALAQRAIQNNTQEGDLVGDFFGGSGSTLLAAATLGRKAYLSEMNPHYCDVIRKRWAAYAQQNGLDIGDGLI